MKITTHSGNPVQHIGPVKDFNVDIHTLNGAAHIKYDQQYVPDVDADAEKRISQKADQQIASEKVLREQAKVDLQSAYDDLLPSEKRLALERYWTPIIQKLASQHESHCDAVTEFEESESTFRAKVQAEYAYRLKHPHIKTLQVAGDYHFNTLLSGGHIDIEGYRLVERRSNGGGIQLVNGALAPAQGSFTLVYIPVDVPNVQSYAQSSEALAASRQEYHHQLQRLIEKRKAAARKLTEAKQSARDALAAIPSFDDLISDSVKRATRK
ncbi:hypothetical protein [Pantoea sp. GbtcB22]|uniref:hypothetical protein n=1 Tax=Pantoea sp. GbtcB22 TaxID=2824767 RepID=UPI001C2F22B6|nr:hypothetical protein [Pantoea sp. GbtcB22]